MADVPASAPAEIVVLKFGGTSVGSGQRMLDVCEIVRAAFKPAAAAAAALLGEGDPTSAQGDGQDAPSGSVVRGERPIVVLSAMSSYVKLEGTTSRLMEAATCAVQGDLRQCIKVLNKVKSTHLVAIHEALGESSMAQTMQEVVNEELDQLKSFLEAISVIHEISPRSHDVIISLGERLSAKLFAAVLKEKTQLNAVFVSLEQILDPKVDATGQGSSVIGVQAAASGHLRDQSFYDLIKTRMAAVIQSHLQAPDVVPVVGGFFGFVPGGIVETIGRGYTDFTAALIAAGVQAKELQIWKEVDGIFSADPSKVKTAKVLPRISPGEAAELTFYGSEVIHPFTMEQVVRGGIPIRIKNTFRPHLPGTVIDPNAFEPISKRGAVAVTVKDNVTVVTLRSNRKLGSIGFLASVFSIMAKYGLEIDLVSTSEVDVSMTIAKSRNLDLAKRELEAIGTVSVHSELAILSLVGSHMKSTIGISGTMFTTLAKNAINIEMISQGASEINISCVINRSQAQLAMRCVHDELVIAANDAWAPCSSSTSDTPSPSPSRSPPPVEAITKDGQAA
ncbi:aspartokinase [Capsaspora owczarzaki ATCC 30864]|uniref:aspartate kinase n=1 Tax=Capsaspora owczarzaki (strain ATCC 30864) TaxID=595528 RepID=A0A0D2VL98_CAPO3|nr:aspartokinase [Capsaspora owczarzaki ATCC 30864]KJE90882.1 aspartokinase [Capsaspora owczarzaki ATCC 30864]|eukprot:XP_004348870.2 aspartokinase [Capsaspora owczarzaki ATCC 30864]